MCVPVVIILIFFIPAHEERINLLFQSEKNAAKNHIAGR